MVHRVKVTRPLDCVDAVQSGIEGIRQVAIALSTLIPERLLPRLGEPLLRDVFAALEKVEEVRLRHHHGIVIVLVSTLGNGPLPEQVVVAALLSITILIYNRPRTFARIHHHRRNRNEVVLLDKLLRVYQLESFIHFLSIFVAERVGILLVIR